ncbi:MAG TPA: hypothetical protein V6C71_07740 [Coleofasciculaceae cyanobacterium]
MVSQNDKFASHCDAIITATGLQHNLVVVTNNIKHFQLVKDLVLINWRSES